MHTNATDSLYEHGETDNNTNFANLPISAGPRPDLQVSSITSPASVPAGATVSLDFTVINQGTLATTGPPWNDRAYLSLDPTPSRDDILIGTFVNGAALEPGESYRTETSTVVVPKRFRGTVYLIVSPDVNDVVDEWPNEANNLLAQELFVEPLPLADLVMSEVVAPPQAFEGAEIEVRYTVTNLGSGETITNSGLDQWTETIWLARDKNRPHPAQGDVLLKTIPHDGALGVGAGFDRVVSVKLPDRVSSGIYYITPWTDSYDVVLEDTLASNINPDDPNEIDNNNYKAREISVIGIPGGVIRRPDLTVTSVIPIDQAVAGEQFTISWTVENKGPVRTLNGSWVDRILISDHPEPNVAGAKEWSLADVRRPGAG